MAEILSQAMVETDHGMPLIQEGSLASPGLIQDSGHIWFTVHRRVKHDAACIRFRALRVRMGDGIDLAFSSQYPVVASPIVTAAKASPLAVYLVGVYGPEEEVKREAPEMLLLTTVGVFRTIENRSEVTPIALSHCIGTWIGKRDGRRTYGIVRRPSVPEHLRLRRRNRPSEARF